MEVRMQPGVSSSARRSGYLKALSNDLSDQTLVSQMLCASSQRKKADDALPHNKNSNNEIRVDNFSLKRSQTAFGLKRTNSNKTSMVDKSQHLDVQLNTKKGPSGEQAYNSLKRSNTTLTHFGFRTISRETSSINRSSASSTRSVQIRKQNEINRINVSLSNNEKNDPVDVVVKNYSRGKNVHIVVDNNRKFNPERILEILKKIQNAVKKAIIVVHVIKILKEKQSINSFSAMKISKVVSIDQDIINEDLIFDKNPFKRAQQHLHENIKNILRTDIEQRNEHSLRTALSAINQMVPEFEEFPQHIQKSFIKYGYFEEFEPARMILKEGHFASYYYLIVSGNVMVTLVSNDKITGEIKSRPISFLKRGNNFFGFFYLAT